ncbi:hypothetical protein D9M73_168420 [compost metagenome]
MIDPDVQMVLFLAHLLPRQLDAHAQQADVFVVALGIAVLNETQWSCTTVAISLQRRQAQHLEMFRSHLGPRQRRGFRRGFWGFRGILGGGFSHHGNPLVHSKLDTITMPASAYRQNRPGLEAEFR